MAKFWNFVFFQAGWFACILGAAHQEVFWPVLASFAYIGIVIRRADSPLFEAKFIFKVLLLGVSVDSLLYHFGFMNFHDAWPSSYLSPMWMWVLWVLFSSTVNQSLSWLQGKPLLGAVLGGIFGPISYEAGIRMGAGSWGPSGQLGGLAAVSVVWVIAIPLIFYWAKRDSGSNLIANQ
ncbi:Protein of unknown function [Polynucleobacter meluiroseus]|uniref:DUF2878 domain-containing protein n=1 Tax=Polynucleobacter meluiroseus TaxID=1938814 RepID=A0A240DXJ4_9BURK|nr:DUF2878 domain-containing protein [Polynucleobacter meluiroseus]SNX27915.1 Protein of unknown function [Polynucleobacter meluiroseus]